MPTLRANDIVIGWRPIPSLEFQFILLSENLSGALSYLFSEGTTHEIHSEYLIASIGIQSARSNRRQR
jgi:hypothetical protein